jgi:hypothetical protein
LIGECLDCLNAFIDHLIALFNLLEQQEGLFSLVAPKIALSNKGVDEPFETSLDGRLESSADLRG